LSVLDASRRRSDDELRRFLDVAYRFGFEGVTLHPYDYKDFLGDGEWSRWKVIVDHARKLGLAVWQQDDKNYPSGYAAGTIVREDRTLARWKSPWFTGSPIAARPQPN